MNHVNICVAGEGAFGKLHLEALTKIQGANVEWLVGANPKATEALAIQYQIPHWSCDLLDALKVKALDAVILATPTPIHAQQAKQVMLAGKHVLIEIPMAQNLKDATELVGIQNETEVIAMVGHVCRFNPSHQWINQKIKRGELHLQQLNVQTYFFRRQNTNALGEPRSWVDHLLWHHACHSVDLFQYQTGQKIHRCFALEGPKNTQLGIAMDICLGLQVPSGEISNVSLSFNHQGPIGSVFRYICEEGTFVAYYDELRNGEGQQIDLSAISEGKSGIELMDQEFVQSIGLNEQPNGSLAQCLSAMETLHTIEKMLDDVPN